MAVNGNRAALFSVLWSAGALKDVQLLSVFPASSVHFYISLRFDLTSSSSSSSSRAWRTILLTVLTSRIWFVRGGWDSSWWFSLVGVRWTYSAAPQSGITSELHLLCNRIIDVFWEACRVQSVLSAVDRDEDWRSVRSVTAAGAVVHLTLHRRVI